PGRVGRRGRSGVGRMCGGNPLFHGGLNGRAHNFIDTASPAGSPNLKGDAMRRNLAVLVCAAGCVCLVGCHRYERTDDTRYDGRALSDTGTSGSSASPYTPPRRVYKYEPDTGYTGSSAAPN